MKTSRRTWLQRLSAAGAGLLGLVTLSGRRTRAAEPVRPTIEVVNASLKQVTGLKLADPTTVLGQSLTMSTAIQELNEICTKAGERGDFFWGYSSNHAVDAVPYYYSIWRCRRNRKGDSAYSLDGADFLFHGPFVQAVNQIQQYKLKRPELEVQGHVVQIVYGREVTLTPKSTVDEHDENEYLVQIGGTYLMIHANALTHAYSGEIKSYTRLYDMSNPHQEIQAGLNLMEIANSELSPEEAEGVKNIMQMVRGAKPAFPPPPAERPTQVITVHSLWQDRRGGIV